MSTAVAIRGTIYIPGYVPPVWAWMRRKMVQERSARADWADLYAAFIAGWAAIPESRRPTAQHFGKALKHICEHRGIRIELSGDRVYCCDVRLIEP